MLVDLVQTWTGDGMRLDGMLQEPAGIAGGLAVDAFCLVHGTGSNFYSSSLFDALAGRLLDLGCAVLRVNTRGHDGISTAVLKSGGRRQGAAYEVVDECRHDLAAWFAWLQARGLRRIGLAGHSMGAVKALYAASQEALPVACLLAISPPCLSYSRFCSSPEGPRFLEDYGRAERLVAEGQPAALFEAQLPLPLVIMAAGYLEKYGPEERYNFLRSLSGLACPTLVTLGALEVAANMAFRGLPEELAQRATKNPRLAVDVVPDADHFYTRARPVLLDRVEAWLRGVAA